MKNTPRWLSGRAKWFTSLSTCALIATSSFAQNDSDFDDEDVYELSPFEINSSEDVGYDAQSTLSGTRFNTSVKDVGVTMTILTEQFLEDVGLTDVNELLKFTPGGDKETTQGSTGISANLYWGDQTVFRGIKSENIVRNTFSTNMPSDTYNAGRFEVSRGSNSILFGVGNPAGLVNRYTTDAIFSDQYKYKLRLKDTGSVRHEFTANKVLIEDKLAVFVAALQDNDESWIKPAYQDQERYYASLTYKPIEKLTIKLRYEKMDWDRTAVSYGLEQDAVTPFLNAAAAAGNTPAEHAINRNFWVWIVPGTVGSEFRDWGYAGGNTNNVIADGSGDPYLRNWQNKVIGANNSVVGTNTVSLPVGFVDRDFSIAGHSNSQYFKGDNIQANIHYKVNDFIDLEYAYNKEDMVYDFIVNWSSNTLNIDGSATLADGVTPNPNAGRYFVNNNVNWNYVQNRMIENHRFTASVKYDFTDKEGFMKWFGSHNAALMYEKSAKDSLWDGLQLINTTPLPGFTEDLWNPWWGANNGIRFINYVDIDTNTIYGVHNARKFKEIANTMPGIAAEHLPVTGAVGGGNNFTDELDSKLLVIQSRFWEDRIVTTLGWREDDMYVASSGQPGQNPDMPAGIAYYAKDVEQVVDEAQSALSPDTLSRGIVYHAYRGTGFISDLSLYYNYSDSFGSGNFNQLPDGSGSPNKTGETTDFGLKFGLFDGKVNGVFTMFENSVLNDTTNNSIAWNNYDQLQRFVGNEGIESASRTRDTMDIVSKGWELQLTANITQNWRVMASFDHYKTEQTNIFPITGQLIDTYRSQWLADPTALIGEGQQARTVQEVFDEFNQDYLVAKAQEGSRTMNERRNKLSIVTSYTFSDGVLKGLGVGADMVWQDKASTGYSLMQNEFGGWVPNPDKPFFGDDIMYLGAHIRYNRKIWDNKIDWTIQLNAQNIGGIDPYVVRHGATAAAPTTAVPTYMNRGLPTIWMLTNTFKF